MGKEICQTNCQTVGTNYHGSPGKHDNRKMLTSPDPLNVPSRRGSERQRVLAISLKSEDNDSALYPETVSILRKVLLRELRGSESG